MKSFAFLFVAILLTACGTTPPNNTANNTANSAANERTDTQPQLLTVVGAPQRVTDLIATRGDQDKAMPTLKIVEPAANATVNSSTVKVKLDLGGDLKGYMPHKDPDSGMGNHIHVILDNQPYEAYYELGQPFELRNVADGEHTLRVFPSRPWHESYKNEGAFQMVKFTVKSGGADTNKPATTNTGQQMSNANTNSAPTTEGKDMQNSTAGAVDATKPLLTYSRPKGEYKGNETDPIMIDFWLSNAKLKDDGGQYSVRYSVSGFKSTVITKWGPIWLSGWSAGKYTITLELVDFEGRLVDNGGYNSTTREITITR